LADAEKSRTVEELLPVQLAFSAALATGIYAVTLHFDNGPLASISVNQLAFAALAVAVLLYPVYRYMATACWKRGIADVFSPGSVIARQKELARVLRKSFDTPIGNATLDDVRKDVAIPLEAKIDENQ
jgi:hypothetical protein